MAPSNCFQLAAVLLYCMAPIPEIRCSAGGMQHTVVLMGFLMLRSALGSQKVRGAKQLLWTLPGRSLHSDGVVVQDCEARHSHCSNLTLTHLLAIDTGTYTCRYSSDAPHHKTHMYIYVKDVWILAAQQEQTAGLCSLSRHPQPGPFTARLIPSQAHP
ncbi:Vascular endothelial growth factor receptor kdr-like [Merluccius polli]|uniref:Vascular endothelial growth factor receptor kdr-like n=1 Tax=Merluccius polli TaxID=89951 RepID=A0AA47MHF3_MERPO|nr:Vascular endothelial growth factor receptor kdr-like [Merluccius polli]